MMIRIFSSKQKLWASKDVGESYAMLSELGEFTPDELRGIALWMEQHDWKKQSGYPVAVMQQDYEPAAIDAAKK